LTLGKRSRPNQGNTEHRLLKDSKASRTPGPDPSGQRTNAGAELHTQNDSSEQAKPRNDNTTSRERGKKVLKHLANMQPANMHPVGVPDRRAARHAARIALRRLVRTRKTQQKDHDPEHRNSACRQRTTDLARVTQVPGTGSTSSHSIMITSAPAMLTGEIYLRVDDPHMPR